MAQIPYRANLTPSVIPLLSQFEGQDVIINQRDGVYIPGVNPPDSASVNSRGVPQIYYGHNIMPSTYGVQSVGYSRIIPDDILPEGEAFDSCFLIQTEDGFKIYASFVQNNSGQGRIWAQTGLIPAAGWIPRSDYMNAANTSPMSIATVNGISYMWVAGIGAFTYNYSSGILTPVTFTGLEPTQIDFITTANGYILAFGNAVGVAWSSATDATDFTPSITTGAGSGKLQMATGRLICAVATSLGCIVYTTNNAISITYSGNSRFPFNFLPVPAAGGILSQELATQETVNGSHYAYTTNGLQQVTNAGAKTILPNVTDFLGGLTYEHFDTATNKFVITSLTQVMKKKLALVSDRYLVISYGMVSLTDCIVVDMIQSRMGKLYRPHVDVFEEQTLDPEVVETPRSSIALMNSLGAIDVVNFNLNDTATDACLVLGKYQLIRERHMLLSEVDFENIQAGKSFEVRDLYTLDGKNIISAPAGYLDEDEGVYRKYYFDTVGLNHSLVCTGTFNLVSLLIWGSVHGRF